MDVYSVVVLIHILVGLLVVYFAAKAYKKSKYIPMLFLTFGFFLIVIGDTIVGDLIGMDDSKTGAIIEEVLEIAGFLLRL
jgi:predicted small integral membrane protein